MININNYPEEFIKWVDQNIEDFAREESIACEENVTDIIIESWQKGEYDDLENEIAIWYDSYEQAGDAKQAKDECRYN